MPSPIKILHGQKLIRDFMQATPRSPASADASHQSHNHVREHNIARSTSQDREPGARLAPRSPAHYASTSPDGSVQLNRRRRIITDDDDEPIPIVPVQTAPVERIYVQDTADESDANFAVILLPASRQSSASHHATLPPHHSNSTPRRSQRVAAKSQEDVRSKTALINSIVSVLNICAQDPNSDENKNEYEDEAEESDMDDDFIDDAEPEESNDEAQALARETCDALRNRRKWKETEFECPLCADLRVVLRHLLKRK